MSFYTPKKYSFFFILFVPHQLQEVLYQFKCLSLFFQGYHKFKVYLAKNKKQLISFSDPPPTEGYAVIVWLHSGDFLSGNSSELNPFHLVFKQKVIVITISYRLGILGFFTSMDGEAPGNFGLMDQAAALLWINNNIKLFGGSDQMVTLMGHGAGAVSASLHLTSGEWSSELFDRAIIMSGTSLTGTIVREARSYANALDQTAAAFGCYRRPTSAFLDCLRRVDTLYLLGGPFFEWGPVIDDGLSNTTIPFIPSDPRILVERSDLRKLPVMIGFTNMEDSLDVSMGELMEEGITSDMYDTLVGDIILNELSQLETNETCGGNNQAILDALNFVYKPYPPVTDPHILRQKFIEFSTERNFASPSILLATHLSRNAPTYAYRFDIKPKTVAASDGLPIWAGVPHRYDLVFVWGLPYWVQLENQTQWESADKRVADIIMTLWTNFAKFAEPTKLGVYIKWDAFTPQDQGVLIIDRSFNMSDSNSLNYQAMQFWNDYYPKVVGFASQCCNVTDAATTYHSINSENTAMIVLATLTFLCQGLYLTAT